MSFDGDVVASFPAVVCVKQVLVSVSVVTVNQQACYHQPYICILS